MKMKLILALSAAVALGFAACGGDDKDDDKPTVTDAGITVTDGGITVTDAGHETSDASHETTDASVADASEPTDAAVITDASEEDASIVDQDATEPPAGEVKLVISQIYLGGTSAESESYDHTYVEIFNAGAAEVNLKGYALLYANKKGEQGTITRLSDYDACANDGCKIGAGHYFLMQIKTTHSGEGISSLSFDVDLGGAPNIGQSGTFALVDGETVLEDVSNCASIKTAAIDLVGIGSDNTCSEHPATGITAQDGNRGTKVYMRKGAGCTDTDNDSADFEVANPEPRNLSSDANVCE